MREQPEIIAPETRAFGAEGIGIATGARIEWARRIRKSWGSMLEAVLETGRAIAAAKEALPHGEFLSMIESDLPFGARTAQCLMKVAQDKKITNANHGSRLPASWRTLYELAKLDEATFDSALTLGEIRPDMERHEATLLRTGERRRERLARAEHLARESRPISESPIASRTWPVLYVDPPWQHRTWSEGGKLKSPENHYPTLSHDELKALPVAALAGPRAALFLWATVPHLAEAVELMSAWRFEYRSHLVWFKTYPNGEPRAGTGHWLRNTHELLLLGIRGDMPAPVMGSQENSVIAAPVGRHSEKPVIFREMIERYFTDIGRIELFARTIAPGWEAWGNEVENFHR